MSLSLEQTRPHVPHEDGKGVGLLHMWINGLGSCLQLGVWIPDSQQNKQLRWIGKIFHQPSKFPQTAGDFLNRHPTSVRNGISFITNTAPTVRTCQTSGTSIAFIWSLFIFWCDPIIRKKTWSFPTLLPSLPSPFWNTPRPTPPPQKKMCPTRHDEGRRVPVATGCRWLHWLPNRVWRGCTLQSIASVNIFTVCRGLCRGGWGWLGWYRCQEIWTSKTKNVFWTIHLENLASFQESKCAKVSLAQIKWTSHNLPQQ